MREKEFINNIKSQSINPPGNDLVMKAFYKALLDLIKNDMEFKKFVTSILKKRKIMPAHFSNLIYRSIQYVELFVENNKQYPTSPLYMTSKGWKARLKELFLKHKVRLKGIMLERETVTTIYQRYLGDKIVLNALFPNEKSLSIADFGCGGNYGLPGLSLGTPFKQFVDKTPELLATRLKRKRIFLDECLAIDLFHPSEVARWREACTFYPQELKGQKSIKNLRNFEKKINAAKNVKFLKGDLLRLNLNNKKGMLMNKSFDAILLNTILYQMNSKDAKKVIALAIKQLKPDGVLIVQDFAIKTKLSGLNFNVNWFGRPGMYGTFIANKDTQWKFKHVLAWGNGRCTSVSAGPDFSFLLKS